jgi:poly(glycerol-phosphate) alpha-glucosyltransferase
VKLAHLTWLVSEAGGGIPPVARALVRAQASMGHLAELHGLVETAHRSGPHDARVKASAIAGPVALGFSPSLGPKLRRFSPDVTHLHGLFTWPSQVARRWGARTRRPVVIAPHGMLEPWALRRSAWKKKLFWWAIEDENLHRAGCLHALNVQEADNFRRLGLRNPIAVIPNGVELPSVLPDPLEFGRRWPALAYRKVLLFLGRIHPKKGLPVLLDALSLLATDRFRQDGWILTVAGPDQLGHTAEVREKARRLGLEHDVVFTGPLHGSEKASAFAGASAFVLPSHSEGFSVAVLEAMSYGLPVVITRQCNFDVAALAAGWVCEPERDSVARALRGLLECSDAERRRIGQRGRDAVAAGYTWDCAATRLVKTYEWLLGGGPKPSDVEFFP